MVFELGQNLKLGSHSNIICQMIFFLNFICFHVLHNARHKISTIFMMLKMFSCADLFFKSTMLKHLLMNNVISLWFWIYYKNHHRVYTATVTGICVCSQGSVREKSGIFFSANRVATLLLLSYATEKTAWAGFHSRVFASIPAFLHQGMAARSCVWYFSNVFDYGNRRSGKVLRFPTNWAFPYHHNNHPCINRNIWKLSPTI